MEGLLRKTDKHESTAVNMAVVSGSPKMVLLLKWAVDVSNSCKNRDLAQEKSSQKDWRYWEVSTTPDSYQVRANSGSAEQEATEITNDTGSHIEPYSHNVTDDAIGENIYDDDKRNRIAKVYELIELKLMREDNRGDHNREEMKMLKDGCENHVDLEFVPIAHVFLHFLICIFERSADGDCQKFQKILKRIFVACDHEEGARGSLLVALFHIRGRTILHAACQNMEAVYYSILHY